MKERRSRRDPAYRLARQARRDAERDAFARQMGQQQSEFINACMEAAIKKFQKTPLGRG